MAEPITVTFQVEGLEQTTEAFRLIGYRSQEMSRRVVESSNRMNVSYKRLAFNIAHLSTAALSLENTWRRVAQGQINVIEGIFRSIPAIVSLISAIEILTAVQWKRVAAQIAAWATAGPPGWAVLAVAGGVAASALAAFGMSEGFSGGGVTIHGGVNVYGVTEPRRTADEVVAKLGRRRMYGGY